MFKPVPEYNFIPSLQMKPPFWILGFIAVASASDLAVVTQTEEEPEAFVETASTLIDTSDVFQATDDWQEIHPGQVVPAGLHIRLNLQTGKKEGRRMEKQKSDESISKIDDNSKNLEGGSLRSYKELHDKIAEQKIRMNTEFEAVEYLMLNYANSTLEGKLAILDDLEYYLHQYDNARDFVAIGGLDLVIRGDALVNDSAPTLRDKGALVFAACVQSHNEVKEKVTSTGWVEFLLDRLTRSGETSEVRRRIVHGLACLIRGHSRSAQVFRKNAGFEKVLWILSEDGGESLKTRLKVLLLIADVTQDVDKDVGGEKGKSVLCGAIVSLVNNELKHGNLDVVEKIAEIADNFFDFCLSDLQSTDSVSIFESLRIDLARRNAEEDLEIFPLLEMLKSIVDRLEIQPRDEL